MVKMVILLDRKDGWSHDEFRDRWLDEHAPLVEDLPNVRKYVTSLPTDPERAEHDGVAELHFDGMADLGEAFDSDAGEALQADAAEFSEMAETMYVEETVQYDASE
jgi:uncharacterized protein (TIGR02118 family)